MGSPALRLTRAEREARARVCPVRSAAAKLAAVKAWRRRRMTSAERSRLIRATLGQWR